MITGNKPSPPRCPLGALQPSAADKEQIKADAWKNDGILVVSMYDIRLNWADAQYIKTIGDMLYGKK